MGWDWNKKALRSPIKALKRAVISDRAWRTCRRNLGRDPRHIWYDPRRESAQRQATGAEGPPRSGRPHQEREPLAPGSPPFQISPMTFSPHGVQNGVQPHQAGQSKVHRFLCVKLVQLWPSIPCTADLMRTVHWTSTIFINDM